MRRESGGGPWRLLRILRDMLPRDEYLEVFVRRVAERYPRSTIVLFGSRARGDSLPYSDYDVAVILEGVGDRVRVAEEVARLKPPELPLDLVILEPGDLEDPIIGRMLEGCRTLYDGLGLDPCGGSRAQPPSSSLRSRRG